MTGTQTSTASIAERVRDARARGIALRIVGAGTWLDAGAPCTAPERVSVGALSGVVEYEPGDLTITVGAGTTLSELERVTAAHGQWLPLDPLGDGGTIGATVATGSYGPLSAAFGTPRDQVLGCEVVTGAGETIRAGGRVVKNVAGFDVTRLMIGAWGTLGVITEVALRLRARPEAEATIAVALGGHDAVERAARWLRVTELAPLAAELVSPAMAKYLSIESNNAAVLLLRLGGNSAYLRAALESARALGDVETRDVAVWQSVRRVDARGDTTIRLSAAPADVVRIWEAVRDPIEAAGGMAHASLKRGMVRCVLPSAADTESRSRLAAIIESLPRCTCIPERAPQGAWAPLALDPVTDALSAGVRRTFDPDGVLNPGILGTLSPAFA